MGATGGNAKLTHFVAMEPVAAMIRDSRPGSGIQAMRATENCHVVSPFRDGTAGMIESNEQALVEHAAVETLDITVLHPPFRRDVVPLYLVILRPGKDGI